MSGTSGGLSPVKQALIEIRRLRQQLEAVEQARTEPIAIVGTGMRFPGGATDAERFHEQLCAGLDAIGVVPPGRWDADRYFSEDRDAAGTMYTRHGGFLDDVAGFDPEFFGISPVEAATIDPQQRLLLEVCWEALEDAGIAASSLRGSRTGVYLGIAAGDYGRMSLADAETVDEYASLGTAFSVAAGRISYVLGLHGPAVSIDTACSASLVALHQACQALRTGECDSALAAGVNLILAPEITINFCRAGMLAPDGRCKTFDAGADGYVRSEGCAVVMLRRLRDAQRNGDRILGVIRGSAINQDGRSSGLTAPNGPAQEAVIRTALANAGLEPRHIGYVEAHGTGTSLGDPIELKALGAVFGSDRPDGRPLLVGSVKTNVGHLEAAAGMAGLIKTMQALRHGVIPPHRNFSTPNPHVAWGTLPIAVPTAPAPFEPIDGKRRAGLSSFGFSGTNVHVILEEPPRVADATAVSVERPLDLLALSAPRPEALRELAERYVERLTAGGDTFSDICHTANAGRSHFRHRVTVRAADAPAAARALREWLAGTASPAVQSGGSAHAGAPGAALFVDNAAPVAATAWTLLQTAPRFAEVLERCDAALRALMPAKLIEMLDPASENHTLLELPEYAHPAAFSVQLALAALWESWGIRPDILIGNGTGELAAACHAGVLNVDDAMRLVVLRARLPRDSRALDQAARALRTMTLSAPAHVQIVSARLGRAVTSAELVRAEHWLEVMQRAGDAGAGIAAARAEGARWIVSIGVADRAGPLEGVDVTVNAPGAGADPWAALLDGLARLYTAGIDVQWSALDSGARRRVDLPRYPFQRRRYWLPTREASPAPLDSAARMDAVQRATLERAGLAPLDMNVGAYPQAWAALEVLNRELGRNVLARLGAFTHPGATASISDVLEQCRIDTLYRSVVSRWLAALAEEGTLRHADGAFTAQQPLAVVDPAPHWDRAAALLSDNQPLLAYLRNCAALLDDVIAGRASPLETLFPDGSFELATALYEQSAVMRYVNGIAATAVRVFAETADPKRQLRVLEFGGGTGGTTSSILRALPAERTRYDFTDVSDLFLGTAAERFVAWPFVRTALFDVEREPAQQGFTEGSYDIVLGANVLHAAKDLRAAIARVQSLLAPGGMLLLVESTGHLAWHDFSTGLIEGWQHFTDDLRVDTPLLPAARWVQLLGEAGLEGITAAPGPDSPASVLKQHVIFAWRPADAAVPRTSARDLPLAVQRDTPMAAADGAASEFVQRLRDALASEREEIAAAAIRDCVVDVLHLDAARPPAKDARLMDLGVDSLLAVRLRNVLQKRLGLPRKLPATLIFDYPTIARIAALIVDRYIISESAGAAAIAAPAGNARAAELAALTDAEAEALLLSRLEAEGLA